MNLTFVETDVFTRRMSRLGLEAGLRELQMRLLENPTAGAVDPGTGGLRKIRIPDRGRGKGTRGGARELRGIVQAIKRAVAQGEVR